MEGGAGLMPVVSKTYCSAFLTTLVVRRRPHVVNGGGFVVTDSNQKVVFVVDGCGRIGAKGVLLVRDGDGASILRIRKKEGVIQALSCDHRWNGYLLDYDEGKMDPIFSLRDTNPCFPFGKPTRISIHPKSKTKPWDYELLGSFAERNCAISTRNGAVAAQVIGLREITGSKDLYSVVVQPGYDQAFVIGVIAVLDNINGESTSC
ncbi:hypothetical protein HPP92_016205 [Vanilla planifolia]|uniref:Protein LURP-one-related 6 n=1 Tax=Vanilla planifolia TaxID=51239 RepID=A0A835QAH6_VANPL|nr:hypothetical protein HPP92_016205 [Vanilla planifolia]